MKNTYMHIDYFQYRGTPYLNMYNSGWQHCPSLSWEESHNTLHPPQERMANREATMDEWRRVQIELATSLAHFMDEIN